MIRSKILFIINKFIRFLQRYCYILIPNDEHEDGYSIISRSRFILFLLFIIAIILMISTLLIVRKDIYNHKIYILNKIKPFQRVEIADREGNVLVQNIEVYDLYLQSSRMENPKKDLLKINQILPNTIKNVDEILKKLKERKESNKVVFIKSGLNIHQRQLLVNAEIEGLFFEKSERRFYTNSSVNSITGYCNQNQCISGIEKSMNSYLKTNENDLLKLSIDIKIQNILREILNKRIIETNSQGAVGLIMKIKTGELISAVSLPDCDFNDYSNCSNSALFNRYSLGIYELGSVFKIFLSATALKSGVSPYKKYKRGAYKIDDYYTIHDIDNKEKSGGEMSLIDIIKYSSNVGCAKVMEDITIKEQINFLSNLGLLEKLHTDIPEIGRPIYPKKWTFANGVTISYGHGIAVSPLQFVSAIASLLKNEPVRPTFLKSDDDIEYNYKYLSKEKHEILKDIMRQVINNGAGKTAYIDEYDIGGKTGTAIQYENGKYNKYSMVLSFVTALPMYDPQYVFFIMLDRPKTDEKNNSIVRASNILGKTMKNAIEVIGPILNIKPI